ncbi:hypothetical protein STANM309S_00216 [Streptomyces tanashiensis]
MILIVSHDEDHTRGVVRRLESAGREVVRVDLADFPARGDITLEYAAAGEPVYTVRTPTAHARLERCRAAWWRRVRPFTVDHRLGTMRDQRFAVSETGEALHGLFHSLDCTWVNPPALDAIAHHKPYQLGATPVHSATGEQALAHRDRHRRDRTETRHTHGDHDGPKTSQRRDAPTWPDPRRVEVESANARHGAPPRASARSSKAALVPAGERDYRSVSRQRRSAAPPTVPLGYRPQTPAGSCRPRPAPPRTVLPPGDHGTAGCEAQPGHQPKVRARP